MSGSFEHDAPLRVTVGTVGEPGRRTFYLQVGHASGATSLKLEKQHVAALGTALVQLLSDLPATGALPTDLDLVEPVIADWAVRSMELAYQPESDRVVLVVHEVDEDEEDRAGAVGRVMLTREQAAALAARSNDLVEAGRPPCPFCGHPLDPAGHSCPRTNGHRPPAL